MIDPNLFLRTWLLIPQLPQPDGSLLDNPVLAALLAQLPPPPDPWPSPPVFAGHLPEHYDPRPSGNGMAIVIRVGGSGMTSGGTANPEIPIIDPRMQVSVWAGINEYQKARTLDRAIFDWIHGKTSINLGDAGFALGSLNQVLGQDINDPSTGLATVVSFWHLTLREN
jgi:hypothetical protein